MEFLPTPYHPLEHVYTHLYNYMQTYSDHRKLHKQWRFHTNTKRIYIHTQQLANDRDLEIKTLQVSLLFCHGTPNSPSLVAKFSWYGIVQLEA